MKKRQKRLKKKVSAMTRLALDTGTHSSMRLQAKQKKPRTDDATGGGPAAQKEGDVSDSDGSDEEEELAGRGDLD